MNKNYRIKTKKKSLTNFVSFAIKSKKDISCGLLSTLTGKFNLISYESVSNCVKSRIFFPGKDIWRKKTNEIFHAIVCLLAKYKKENAVIIN